jgi:glycosyltransferase involved in cell wall biosynthesis
MEGHPKALIEAMASGCICVASDVPGNNEVLTECKCQNLLFKNNNEESLYEKLKTAIQWKEKNIFRRFALDNYEKDKLMAMERDILFRYVT